MIENQVHTPDSPIHPDAFAHMVGTVRTDPATGLKYTVTRVLFKGASRFHAASVTVQGEIIESAPRPGHPNATMLGAFAAEGFYSNPPVPVEPMPVMIENQTDTPRVLTDSEISISQIDTAVADRAPVKISERNAWAPGIKGILLGYRDLYDNVKVGFVDESGQYTGEFTTVSRSMVELIAETNAVRASADTPCVLTDSDINACHVGSTVTVVADASPYDGVKAVSYTGTLVKLTDNRAYVRREGCKTARPFVRGLRFRYLLHADV